MRSYQILLHGICLYHIPSANLYSIHRVLFDPFVFPCMSQQGMDPYVLKNSMEGEPRKLMDDLNDYHRMWTRLKETYGNPAKIIASILSDTNATKPVIEGTIKGLLS